MVIPRRAVRFSSTEASSRPAVLWAVNPQEAKGRLLSSRMRAPLFRPNPVDTAESLFSDIDEWREEVRPRLPKLILRKAPKSETRARLARSRARMEPHLATSKHALNLFRDEDEALLGTDPDDGFPVATPVDPAENRANMHKLRHDLWEGRESMVLPQRMLVHVLNTALIAVAPPVGAALATYSCLRGESMRATAAAVVMTGLSLLTVSMRAQGMI